MPEFTIADLFTQSEIAAAKQVIKEYPDSQQATIIAEQIIAPVLYRINGVTGQENDAKYLAYALMFVVQKG